MKRHVWSIDQGRRHVRRCPLCGALRRMRARNHRTRVMSGLLPPHRVYVYEYSSDGGATWAERDRVPECVERDPVSPPRRSRVVTLRGAEATEAIERWREFYVGVQAELERLGDEA